ncbi:MAG TPA: carboxypeptidase-like regulatory domain-containing protein, partial [Candidatus Acidoferrum sp.]|nr:carboxypeptidase-like regulatory domain-containing protein [Candidatus Acidoferrum sp.]
MKRISFLFVLVLLLGSASPSAFGQATATGTIQGVVTDKSTSVISGAEVVITSKATGASRTAATSEEGTFRFDFLPAGIYTVKISKNGFTALVQTVEL